MQYYIKVPNSVMNKYKMNTSLEYLVEYVIEKH